MSDEYRLVLYGESLCSKWGFEDGDTPESLLDELDRIGLPYPADWHAVLRRLVHGHLLPALAEAGYKVEIDDIETNHNPIRARRIDGIEIDDIEDGSPEQVTLVERLPEVRVRLADILAADAATRPDVASGQMI